MPLDLEKCYEKAKEGILLDEVTLKLLCIKIKDIFCKENNI